MLLAALLSGRHVMLEGPPGTSKSTVLKGIVREMGVPFIQLTGNSDLTATKLLGYFDPAQVLARGYSHEHFQYGPLTQAMIDGAILYVEEFNRLPDDTTNVFITAISERELTIPRLGAVVAKPDFRIVAALNPHDDIATTRVSRALRDRFCSMRMDYQGREEEIEIVQRHAGNGDARSVAAAVEMVRRTRSHKDVRLGASVRGAIDMVLIARQLLEFGDDAQGDKLLFAATVMALRDKVWLNETTSRTVDEVLWEIWQGVVEELRPFDADLSDPAVKKKAQRAGDLLAPDLPHVDDDVEEGMTERPAPRRILSESEHHLLAHHPGTPEDHHHYLDAPLDREANELLSRGALEEVVSLAEIAPARVAEAMGRHRLVLGRKAHHLSLEKLLLLTWDSLDPETRRHHLDGMIRLVLRMARSGMPYRERHDGPMAAVPYRFHSDELDLDATIERWLASAPGSPLSAITDYADLIVRERLPRRRAYVVMIDQSRSMRGSKAVSAALVSATLLLHLPAEDEWGVIAFAEEAQVIRAVGRRALHDDTVRELLEMRSEGCTDIAAGLEAGFAELAKARMHDRIGILVTDGWLNTGPPPFSLVRQFSRLHVIELPGGDPALCARMAGAGRGTVSRVRSLAEIPRSVRRCLSAT